MKTTLTCQSFIDKFRKIRPDNFSYDGLVALYNWIVEIEEQDGKEIEFDPIAFCCEFTEYDSIEELRDAYDIQFTNMQQISYHTICIPIDDERFIIADF